MLDLTNKSAVFEIAVQKARTAAVAPLSDAEEQKIGDEADRVNVYGVGYKTDRNGRPIQTGIGSENNPSINHWAALKKAEQQGRERPGTYDRMVAELWKKNPKQAEALNLPAPQRAGA